MKYRLIVRPEAEEDVQLAFNWYEKRVLGLGLEFLRCLDAVIAQISRSPQTNQVIYREVRRALTRRFPFGVFYLIEQEKIIVLAVMYTRRDPDLWRKR